MPGFQRLPGVHGPVIENAWSRIFMLQPFSGWKKKLEKRDFSRKEQQVRGNLESWKILIRWSRAGQVLRHRMGGGEWWAVWKLVLIPSTFTPHGKLWWKRKGWRKRWRRPLMPSIATSSPRQIQGNLSVGANVVIVLIAQHLSRQHVQLWPFRNHHPLTWELTVFSCEGQRVNILYFVGYTVSVQLLNSVVVTHKSPQNICMDHEIWIS